MPINTGYLKSHYNNNYFLVKFRFQSVELVHPEISPSAYFCTTQQEI